MKLATHIIAIASILFASAALADSEKRISENLTMTEQQSLHINFPVGSLEIEVTDSNQLEVEIEIKPKKNGWFSSSQDLSNITLSKKVTDNRVKLEIDEDDLQQEWTLRVPRSAAIDINLGVGSIEVNKLANSADIEVGVGSIRVDTVLNDFKRIDLDSGVGDTRVTGLVNEIKENRKMVSSEIQYRGQGEFTLNLEVGVGDIRVRH
ncbi:hypothetical protein PULV_a2673 [Pseudoalteromonas ulvae UL12]|uniref:Adhesin domain-containing protein n=1 Tax=Pseudoalteromonas ulvae TaxID=107327 RepID=A0A244CNZ1_PSEDV|nr:hypothetical protein [Pseudoalteromonas ulvae]MBE0364353.1 hypothetical protein [Pseudoalteromonas ulvae UL12]OUL57333.1 hypothetical protein B1199_14305 [Pseudoalteromonas ulvae]